MELQQAAQKTDPTLAEARRKAENALFLEQREEGEDQEKPYAQLQIILPVICRESVPLAHSAP